MEPLRRTFDPKYKTRPEKIIQFGGGNFLRGFFDWMIDDLNEKNLWNGSAVVVQSTGKGEDRDLNAQDGLYTLYLQGIRNGKPFRDRKVISSVSRCIHLAENFQDYLALAADPDFQFIVSNTTEAGICVSENDRFEDAPPAGFPAKVTRLLHERYRRFGGDRSKGFVFFPCELIEKNGEKLKACVLELAERWNLGDDFRQWIEEANTFCNTLVDRIVPGFPKDRIAEIERETGYKDRFAVEAETFHLWVIEAPRKIHGILPLREAGLNVLWVDDLAPYRTRKVRILNGAHTCMVPVAYLSGLDTVEESVNDPLVGEFIRRAISDEIVPSIPQPPEELNTYAGDVLERFRNPFIRHYLMSISLNAWPKFETRVMPSLLAYREKNGGWPPLLSFSLAALCEFYRGKRGSDPIALNDAPEHLEWMRGLWADCDGSDAALKRLADGVFEHRQLWKTDLHSLRGLAAETAGHLSTIRRLGMREALAGVLR